MRAAERTSGQPKLPLFPLPLGGTCLALGSAAASAAPVGTLADRCVCSLESQRSSQPGRYSRTRYLFASGTFVTFMFAASKSSFRPPRRNETAPRLNASEIGPASRKSPCVALPPLHAAIQAATP